MKSKSPSAKHQLLFQQAQSFYQSGDYQQAAIHYRKLLKDLPTHPEVLNALGFIAYQQQKYQQAVQFLSKSLAVASHQANVYVMRGMALAMLDQFEQALVNYDQALVLQPDYVVAHNNRGNVLRLTQRFDEALSAYDLALAIKPDYEDAYYNKANCLKAMGRLPEAIDHYTLAGQLNPHRLDSYIHCGECCLALQQAVLAIDCFRQALSLDPNSSKCHFLLGDAHVAANRFSEALTSYNQAIALNPQNPVAFNNRGNVFKELERFAEAKSDFDQAIQLFPDYAEAYNNRALVLQEFNLFQQSLDDFNQAIALNADYQDALWNKGLLCLLMGNYRDGWVLYENRWLASMKTLKRNFSQPLWLGETSLLTSTLLISYEQGFGDFIQFCRYMPLLSHQVHHLVVEVTAPLLKLATSLSANITYVEFGQALPEFDYYCPLMSLPLAFKTELSTVPANTPYLFADPQRLKFWQAKLAEKNRIRIGLVWSGSKTNKIDGKRSIPLTTFSPLFAFDYEFHCLQKDIREEDAKHLVDFPNLQLHELDDFADTAALIEQMDIIIAVDTSVSHLAAALAKPVWLLLPLLPDFRWLLARGDSPWYPTVKLFRQQTANDWQPVIEQIVAQLTEINGLYCIAR